MTHRSPLLRLRSPRRRPSRSLVLEPLEDRLVLSASSATQLLLTLTDGSCQTVQVAAEVAVSDAISACQARSDVRAVEVDSQVTVGTVPNDTYYSSLWGIQKIGAATAWNTTTGSLSVTVAVIDTGVDYTNVDLYKNIWLNQGELPTTLGLVDTDADGRITFWDLNTTANSGKVNDVNGNGRIDGYDVLNDSRWENGVDNDGNGYKDDLIGWNFVTNTNDPYDDNSHGTHVSGTIGALGNNSTGVVGVNWKVQIAALKFLDASGSGYTSAATSALQYAVMMGIKISNNSWGGGGYSSAMATALVNARAAGHIFVAAAGNSSSNNDTTANYPSNYAYDNVVAVAATGSNDSLASFSSYGATTVDLAAPGVGILSTVPGGGYSSYSGTSMATPHVAGAIALVWAANPNLTYSQVIARILSTVDTVSSLSGKVASGGRLNVAKALAGSTGTIAGTVWNDVDSDGVKDASEAALTGWTVYIDANNNGSFDTGETSSTTTSTGAYSFTVSSGTYTIREVIPTGWAATTPSTGSYIVTMPSTTTGSDGDYLIAVTPGTYIVREVLQSGWGMTTPSADYFQPTVTSGNTTWGNRSQSQFLNLKDAQLASLTQSLFVDGSISRSDMIQILGSAGSDDNVVDTNEFSDLKVILQNSTYLCMPGYVTVLANDVVLAATDAASSSLGLDLSSATDSSHRSAAQPLDNPGIPQTAPSSERRIAERHCDLFVREFADTLIGSRAKKGASAVSPTLADMVFAADDLLSEIAMIR